MPSTRSWLVIIITIAVGASLVIALIPQLALFQRASNEDGSVIQVSREFTLFLGEVSPGGPYGFGTAEGTIASPGPILRIRAGDVVRITAKVTGRIPHNVAITKDLLEGALAMWGGKIGSGVDPLAPSQTGTVTFRALEPGRFFYMCQVPGHLTIFRMFGEFIVEA